MVQEQLVIDSLDNPPPSKPGLKLGVILRFFALWLSSLAILVVIALLTNIEWARRHIETALNQSFHRKVHLGKLSWSIGLQGLAIDTDRLELKEENGNPFISSGPSEIGIAVLPLFAKRLVIKHLEFEKPEVWAVKLKDNKWNFSDLITEGPEIHMLQIERGQLHLRNNDAVTPGVSGSWQSYDAKDIKLSLTFPKGDRNWPLYLSCKVPLKDVDGKAFDSSLQLSATGKGAFKDWQENKYSVDLQLKQFDPAQFRQLYTRLPDLQGICDLHFKGEGTFKQGFVATADGDITKLKMMTPGNKGLELEKLNGTAKLLFDPESIQWKDLKLSLGEWQLDSNGKLLNWQKDTPAYEAKVGGKLSDLKGFFSKVISRFLPEQEDPHQQFTDKKLEKMDKAEKSGELCGTANIELHLKGDATQHNVSTNIKADGIPLAQLLDEEMGNNFLEAFKLDPKAPIKGELTIDPGKRIELKDLEIPMEDSKVLLSGFIDQTSKQTELDFRADNLSFDTFKKRIGQDNPIIKAISGPNGKSKPYSIAGILDLKGKYKTDGKTPDVFIDCSLKGLKLTRQDASTPICSNIKGRIIYEKDRVEIKQLTGVTASVTDSPAGDFTINGYFSPTDANNNDLDLHAHSVSIAQLKDWCTRFGVNLQQPGMDKLGGDLHELRTHLTTRNGQLSSTFTINPSDLTVNLSAKSDGTAQQFRLSSGTISYANDELNATEVQLASRGGKLTFSGNMHGKLDALKFRVAKIKTDGYELADLQSIMKANAPGKPVSSLPQFLTPNSTANLHGKLFGDMQLLASSDGMGLSGIMGFNNAGGKFGKTGVTVDKLTGLAVITKDQLVLQDTTGQIGKSSFSLDGVISNYVSNNASWQGQLRGQFCPDEVDSIMENLGHGIAIDSVSTEPLNLRVTGSGDKANASITFGGKASAAYGLSLKTAFGTFHQPKGRPLGFHGGLDLNEQAQQLTLNDFQLNSSNEVLQANGTFKWASEQAEKPASLSFALSTPSPVKSATVLEIVSQTDSGQPMQIGGTSQLNLKVEGPVNDLVLSGSVALDKNSLPNIHLDSLSGRLDLPGWHLNRPATPGTDAPSSLAKLQLKSLSSGGLTLHDANATISLDSNSKILFKDFSAAMAGGKLTLGGYYNPQTQSYHADVNVSKIAVDDFVKDILDHSGGVSGLADLSMSLDSSANGDPAKSLTGTGQFNVYQGSVASFGKLQEKLNESNLLQQGLFGFNVNNLLQAMMPVKSGQFNEVSGKFNIGKGEIIFDQLRFEGNNLRMRAAGNFDFIDHTMKIDVAGDIPRVSSSIIPGALGEMSRKVTLQRMFRIVTFKKLKDLPSLPLLGDIANDDPRAFAFSANTSTEPPKLITQAVEKSFHWLPNKPFASAHPVPGI